MLLQVKLLPWAPDTVLECRAARDTGRKCARIYQATAAALKHFEATYLPSLDMRLEENCFAASHFYVVPILEEENGKLCPLDDKDSQSKHCSIQEVKKDNKERLSPLDDQDSQSKSSSNQAIMKDTLHAVSSSIKEELEDCPLEHEDEDCEIKRSLNIITVLVDTTPGASSNIKEEEEACPIEHDNDDCEIKRSLNIVTVVADLKTTVAPNIKEEQEDCSVDGQDSETKGSTSHPVAQQLETGKMNEKDSYTCSECKMNFTHKSTLKQHQQIHKKQRLFPCTECEKSFFKKADLVGHRRIHEDKLDLQINLMKIMATHIASTNAKLDKLTHWSSTVQIPTYQFQQDASKCGPITDKLSTLPATPF
ncbi:hypothetical protein NDU88_007735 [Pleurodeles waltl]|uniref:C2H2-type domain-containing protein n=1 Tax=Pleurodeles waltl TaxID=8319 RepID=A0AAV7STB8_PLEWA|nr:hypothetical protein NDU88_007735 [Pleurodeles waltl]